MTTQYQILKALETQAPLSRKELETFLNESYRGFQTQLDRLSKKGFIRDIGDHVYIPMDSGSEALKVMDYARQYTPQEGFSLTITEADLMNLDDKSFNKVWDYLGKILRTKYSSSRS